MMTSPSSHTFLVLPCPECARAVLAQRTLTPDEDLVWCCLHCDAPLDADHPDARWVGADALDNLGYISPFATAPKHGEEGGCRDGQCGVQQPTEER